MRPESGNPGTRLLQAPGCNLLRRGHVESIEMIALVDDLAIALHDVEGERTSNRLGHVANLQLCQSLGMFSFR